MSLRIATRLRKEEVMSPVRFHSLCGNGKRITASLYSKLIDLYNPLKC
jgi:hypothetical protein